MAGSLIFKGICEINFLFLSVWIPNTWVMHANQQIACSFCLSPFLLPPPSQKAGFKLRGAICYPVTAPQEIDLCCFFIFIHEIKSQETQFHKWNKVTYKFWKGWVQTKWVWLLYPWINPVHEIYKLMLPCYFCWTYVGHSELSSCLLPLPDQTTY